MGIANQFLKQFGAGDNLKDFAHASRLFVGDNYNLAPRQGFLYHVFFDINPQFSSKVGRQQQIESGMLVKSVDLPKFSIDTKTLNNYNKWDIVQTKVKYDPVNIVFHDDHADVIRSLWFYYYNYYYRDADLGYQGPSGAVNPGYRQNTKYKNRQNNSWGYTPAGTGSNFIDAIRIYSLSQKRFAEYVLINPKITGFKHGQHQAGNNEAMQHDMSVSYEAVLYGAGWTSKNTVAGFADIHYDHTPSPLTPAGGGTRSILGPGGLIDIAGDVVGDLGKKDSNYAADIFKAFRGYQTLKNTNLAAAAKAELSQIGKDILRGNTNTLSRFFIPTAGQNSPIYQYGDKTNKGISSNGENVGSSERGLTAGTELAAFGGGISLGSGLGLVAGAGSLDKIFNIDPTSGVSLGTRSLAKKTSGEARLSGMPNSEANAYLDSVGSTNEEDVASAADTSLASWGDYEGYFPPGTSTDTNPEGEYFIPEGDSTEFAYTDQDGYADYPENVALTSLSDAETEALFNDATMNDSPSVATNQGEADGEGDWA